MPNLVRLVYLSDFALVAAVLLALLVLWRKLPRPKFLGLAISSTLCVAAGEGFCRLMDLGSPANIERFTISESHAEGQRYPYTPNSRLVYEYPDDPRGYFGAERRVEGTVNAHGFRGPDRDFAKPSGVKRVAFLGDSFTLGFGLRDEDTLPSQFEAALGEEHAGLEALNFGVTATSTPYQVLLLENYVLAFDPDAVVLVVCLNDTERLGTLYFMGLRFFGRIRKHSYLLNAAVGRLESFVVHRAMVAHYREGFEPTSPAWQDVRTALARASKLCEAHGIPLVVAIYPVLVQLSESYPFLGVHETIAEYCRTLDAVVVDLFPAFEGERAQELWNHRIDQHPNDVAQGRAAAWLARVFEERGLLERAGGR